MPEKSIAIIATKGSLDWAYPPFILASTGAALGYDCKMFFTFYGLHLLKRDLNLRVSPMGNPGMPLRLPVLLQAMPGAQYLATAMMKRRIGAKGVAEIAELRDLCLEAGVRLVACQMTVDLFDWRPSDFIDGVEYGGATTFFDFAGESDVCLFI
ncbi:NADH dehydrogenase [Thioalkalivibrio nitratireducens DSM 14787]|uniref:NADH dehydrogenase n=1 Tax=Thioalkalivibrio nitratireducens (strain DSM 14787 / UNIQEM 213 / ALEN2) TaxID=1255043 RepID=L0DR88_THIND|nr:DsrE/DsrF/DrsH-like family protein [Thioalkalivibrio nitratireducens]AGA32104.1 NADH dehydrogenase [Thioalkalivibrio nitratireducens DSM 14787]